MILTKVTLDRNQLKALREPDKTFFISIGHMANEVNIITKLMYWVSNSDPDNDAEQSGQFAYLHNPLHAGHRFRCMLDTDSDGCWTSIPAHGGHSESPGLSARGEYSSAG